MFSKFIHDREIFVPEAKFNSLKTKYDQKTLVSELNLAITEHSILFPLKSPTLDQADADFQSLLDLDSRPLLRQCEKVTSRYENEFKLHNQCVDLCNVGNKASNYFHFDARMNCDSINSPSPMRVWVNPKFRQGVLSALFSLKLKEINPKNLGQCISMRKYVASQFRPSAAKALYDFWAKDGHVLDMCSGWGDRLTGFMASSAQTYTGFDPNLRLHDGYRKQIARYTDKKAVIHWSPFEKAELGSNIFDFAFTSPPYFNIERYSKDDGQSYHYKSVDLWLSKFLFPLVEKTFESLRVGGRLVVNISDVYSNHRINLLCDPMNHHLEKLGAKAGKHFIYRMAKRVGSKANGSIFGEPCWVWIKK